MAILVWASHPSVGAIPGPPGLNFHPVSSHSHPSFGALAEDMYIHPTAILQFGPVWSKKKTGRPRISYFFGLG